MPPLKIVQDISEFHRAGEVPGLPTPGFPEEERIELRKKLIREEVGETLHAIDEKDLIEVADGIADSIVVLVGTALEFGIDLSAVWAEVHRSNMAKFPLCTTCNGQGLVGGDRFGLKRGEVVKCTSCEGRGRSLIRREDGKILKPPGWAPPDIEAALGLK